MTTRSAKPKRVYRRVPDAEAKLRRAMNGMKHMPSVATVSVNIDDLYSVLDELRATRARNAALFREMSAPLPGMEE